MLKMLSVSFMATSRSLNFYLMVDRTSTCSEKTPFKQKLSYVKLNLVVEFMVSPLHKIQRLYRW